VRPQRNIDYGFTRQWQSVVVGVSNKPVRVSYLWMVLAFLIIVLTLLYVRR